MAYRDYGQFMSDRELQERSEAEMRARDNYANYQRKGFSSEWEGDRKAIPAWVPRSGGDYATGGAKPGRIPREVANQARQLARKFGKMFVFVNGVKFHVSDSGWVTYAR